MPLIPNVTRRGAVYQWRRRLPAAAAKELVGSHISVTLGVREQPKARVLANHVNAIATMLLDASQDGFLLTRPEINTILRMAAERHLARLDRIAAMERQQPDFDPASSRRADVIMSWVYRLLAGRGTTATVDDQARGLMAAAGLDAADTAEVDDMLAGLRRQGLVPTSVPKVQAYLEAVGAKPHGGNEAVARNAIYRGMAAALATTARRWDGLVDEDAELVAAMLRDEAGPVTLQSRDTPPASPRVDDAPLVAEGAPAPDVEGASETFGRVSPECHPLLLTAIRFADEMVTESRWDAGTRDQAVQTFRIFAKLLCEEGVFRLESVRQSHLKVLKATFAKLPKSYGKSRSHRHCTIAELTRIGLALPQSKRGLSAATVRRHMSFLQQLIEALRANGEPVDDKLSPSLLKPPKTARGRDKRSTLSQTDLVSIFDLPPFTGCLGWKNKDAFAPGHEIYHRALFFAVIMLHYMGARREEICGLAVADLGLAGEIDYVHIRPNGFRTLKSHAAERVLPLHPEVVRLGFLEYVAAIKALGYQRVFPDLHSGTTDSPSGDKLYDEFVIGLAQAIPDNERRHKVLHSLRKTFGAELKRKAVDIETRADLLGHAGKTVTDEVYVDETELIKKLDAMLKLSLVTAHLHPRPIKLIPWVAEKKRMPYSGRKPGNQSNVAGGVAA